MNPFHDDDAHIMEVEDHGSNTTEEGAQWIAGLSDGTPDPDSQSDTHASSASPHTSSEEESEDSASDEQPTAHKPSRNPIDSFRLVSGNLQGKLHMVSEQEHLAGQLGKRNIDFFMGRRELFQCLS